MDIAKRRDLKRAKVALAQDRGNCIAYGFTARLIDGLW
jgi:hypothetical protein